MSSNPQGDELDIADPADVASSLKHTRRVRTGGQGVLNPKADSIPLYVQSVTLTIRYALEGVPLRHHPDDPIGLSKE